MLKHISESKHELSTILSYVTEKNKAEEVADLILKKFLGTEIKNPDFFFPEINSNPDPEKPKQIYSPAFPKKIITPKKRKMQSESTMDLLFSVK